MVVEKWGNHGQLLFAMAGDWYICQRRLFCSKFYRLGATHQYKNDQNITYKRYIKIDFNWLLYFSCLRLGVKKLKTPLSHIFNYRYLHFIKLIKKLNKSILYGSRLSWLKQALWHLGIGINKDDLVLRQTLLY